MYGIFDIEIPGSTFDNDIRRDSSNNPDLTIFWEHSQDIQRLLMKNRVK